MLWGILTKLSRKLSRLAKTVKVAMRGKGFDNIWKGICQDQLKKLSRSLCRERFDKIVKKG